MLVEISDSILFRLYVLYTGGPKYIVNHKGWNKTIVVFSFTLPE